MRYAKVYKKLLFIPVFFFILALCFLFYQNATTGQFFLKSVELTGGNMLTIKVKEEVDVVGLEQALKDHGASVRSTVGLAGYSILIKTKPGTEQEAVLDAVQEYGIDISEFSWQEIGPALGAGFWVQSKLALIVAFAFMALVVILYFKNLIPAIAVIFAAGSDIICTLAVMQVIGLELSLASFAGLLLVLGYSIDTNILLTTKFLKGTGKAEQRLLSALKTGLTMTVTTIGTMTALLLFTPATALHEIASVLIIALFIDLPNTWLTNAGVLRWWIER